MDPFQRLVEACEVIALKDHSADPFLPLQNPMNGTTLTTNLQYWGIKSPMDHLQWTRHELDWIAHSPSEILPLLPSLQNVGWAQSARKIEKIVALTKMWTESLTKK